MNAEYNKYIMVWYLWTIKEALMKEADRLAQKGIKKTGRISIP